VDVLANLAYHLDSFIVSEQLKVIRGSARSSKLSKQGKRFL